MPAEAEARKPDRYTWIGADEEALEVTASGIGRHLARAGVRVIGLLPTGRDLAESAPGAPGMAPLLATLAGAMVRFIDQEVTIIDHWQTWRRAVARSGAGTDAPPSRVREVRPRVVEVSPTASTDVPGATAALQNTLRILRKNRGVVLVNLGGYADPGTAPSTLDACDGVVLVISARRTRIASVNALVKHIPDAKRVGAILIGGLA